MRARHVINGGIPRVIYSNRDAVCVPVPMYHCFGMVMASLASMTHGSAVVFPSESFDPARALAAVHQERCTALYGVPTMFIGVLDAWRLAGADKAAVASLRTGIMGMA